jgi:hypothetical protein
VGRDWAELELGALRWHWGDAYIICRPEREVWLAERRDDHEALRATTPLGLRDLIIADYAARPVSREAVSPAPRENPDHGCPCVAPEVLGVANRRGCQRHELVLGLSNAVSDTFAICRMRSPPVSPSGDGTCRPATLRLGYESAGPGAGALSPRGS